MAIYRDETEFTDIDMIEKVVGMFERRPHLQRIVRLGLLGRGYDDDLDDTSEDDYEIDSWAHGRNSYHGYPRLSAMSTDRAFSGSHARSSRSACQPPLNFYASAGDLRHMASVQAKESDTERRARLLQEAKKSKEKAEKKRLKKQKQKERKQLERLEKGQQNPVKNEEGQRDAQQSKAEEGEPVNGKPKGETNSSVTPSASAKDTDSSEDEPSDEDSDAKNESCDSEEELDMTSIFVTKAALIAKRKSEQRSRPERKEKKKVPVKERKTVPDKPNEEPEAEKKDPVAPNVPTFEENIKTSTELAVLGNRFASSGDFNMAVKYFTDAIKYNPTEHKLFGNRSFCFEKMQEYEKALADAELCLNMCPGWVKGLFRKGRALAGLRRYEQAAQAFREVIKLDSSYAEGAQELMRVQITQLMEYGFTREQSSNALIIHGTVDKALEVLSKLNHRPGAIQNAAFPQAQVVNVSGVSPVLSANTSPAPAHPPQSLDAARASLKNKPLGPVQNMSNVQSQPKPVSNQATKRSSENSQPPPELFPVWVGNLIYPVTESEITDLFNKAGTVYSVKVLSSKRCAFVNFTKQEHCDEAIRRFHGFELNGIKIAVRYPDRIPHGIGISKSALKADDLHDENMRQNAAGGRRPVRPQRAVDRRGNTKT